MSHWLYQGSILDDPPEGAFGFVYRISNTMTGMKYIGRKYFESVRRVKQKGKTRRKVVRKDSGWRQYKGSSKPLLEAMEQYPSSSFLYEILAFGYTKGQVNYLEENIQMKLDVLTDPMYYNDSVGSKKFIGMKTDKLLREQVRSLTQVLENQHL